ncbi:MAG: DUF3524 domain-containing protein [Deferribacteres bacterium]|nr:DUF3524 domain-containing protein [candidate division KSB1 bacterium]MCB9500355.1 DUF3524 domain-containing protein [Deferribacteres bacterium]
MKIAFVESFYGGSHKSFLDGLQKYSTHDIDTFTLPARFWKWRLRTAAMYFAEQINGDLSHYDLLIATDMINLAELKAMTGYHGPSIMFFHENQLTYPKTNLQSPDYHFVVANCTSALTANVNLFNSDFQLRKFDHELRQFQNRIPEFIPVLAHDKIMKKSKVVYMGSDFALLRANRAKANAIPHILWNHRWAFDKQPAVFFDVLYKLAEENVPFKLIILGENHQVHPKEFLEAKERLSDRIVHFGYVDTEEDYAHFLNLGDIVISTAVQENFGFAVIEAMYSKNLPLLPNRLSYPEILDQEFHKYFLYKNDTELLNKLRHLLLNLDKYQELKEKLYASSKKFDWKFRISEFDDMFRQIIEDERMRMAKNKK